MFATRTDIEFVFLDASGSTKAVAVHIPVATTYSQADVSATALASVLVSLTGCVFLRRRIIYKVIQDGSPPAAIGSSIKRRAVFFYETTDPSPMALVEIPSPVDSIFQTSGPGAGYVVDLSNSDVIAFTDALVANNASNPFGDVITSLVAAYLQSRV